MSPWVDGPREQMWFLSLEAAANFTGVEFDFSFSKNGTMGQPPVGRFSTYGTMYSHIKAKAQRNWTHYQTII